MDSPQSLPQFGKFAGLTVGDTTLVAAVATKKIRVVQMAISGIGAASVLFESGTGGTALTGDLDVSIASDHGRLVLPFSAAGWFETAAGALLNVQVTGAGSVDGVFAYVTV